MKKALSMALALLMLLSLLAMPVYADEYGTKTNPEPVPMPAALAEELVLEPGQAYYYQFPALKFNGWMLSAMNATAIEVDGVMHTDISLIDRCIKVTLSIEGNIVGLHNETDEQATLILTLEQPVGSMEDPYLVEDGDNAVNIPESYPQYFAMYLPMANGDYTLDVSDYENFITYIDTDSDPSTEEDRVQLTKATVFTCESYMPLYFVVSAIGNTPDVTLSVTPPKKGTKDNPYVLFGYDDIVLGESGDGLWPATAEGTYYSLWGLDNATLVVECTGTINLTIDGEDYTISGRREIALGESAWGCFEVVATAAKGASFKLDAVFPVGSDANPQKLNFGKNTLPLDELGTTYYATFTAFRDGVLVMTPNTMDGLGYTDAINLTTLVDYDYIFAGIDGEGASDDFVLTIPVTAGDEVLISSCAGEDENYEIHAMNLVLNVVYEDVQKATIVTQPQTGYAPMGQNVSVSVVATGDGLTYEWWVKNSGAEDYVKSSNTTATYTCPMNATNKNRQVLCKVRDVYGNMVQTKTVLLRESVSVVTAPVHGYAALGKKVSVSVKASGDGLTYAWYYKDSGMSDYAKSSTATATYTTTMTAARSGRMLKCKVTDKYGNYVWTTAVLLRETVSIVKQPTTGYAKMGEKVSVTVKASGDGLTYKWRVKNAGSTKYSSSSITSNTYSVTMSDKVKDRLVFCYVYDKYGNQVKTETVRLREAVSIKTQPKSTTVAKGEKAKVTVKASGDGLTYTWYVKNEGASKYSKSSVTKSTYSVTMSDKVHMRLLYCVVTDKYGNVVQTVKVRLRMK